MPASQGLRSSQCSAPPSSAAVRNPFWPWPRLMNTAGKAAATSSVSGRGRSRASSRDRRKSRPARSTAPWHRERRRPQRPPQRKTADSASRRTASRPPKTAFSACMLQRGVDRHRRAGPPGQRARGIDVGEVGAERLAVAVDQPVGQRDPADEGERTDDQQDQAVAARPLGRQPVAGAQVSRRRLARNEPFRRGCRILREP